MEPRAAVFLRELFATKSGGYPYLLPKAEIGLINSLGSKIIFEASCPIEAADILHHITNNDGVGIFHRQENNLIENPLYFRMQKRVQSSPDQKEMQVAAINITYRSLEKEGHLWIAPKDCNKYHWQGNEKIYATPPTTYNAPMIHDLITALRRAGYHWQDVNLHHVKPDRPTLRLVADNT